MTRPQRLGAIGALVAVPLLGAAWVVGAGVFSSSLDADEQAVVDDVEAGNVAGDPAEAARFVEENASVLLSADVAGAVDAPRLVELFEVAFDGDNDNAAFESVVASVAAAGEIHCDELRPVFGNAIVAQLTWFDTQVNPPLDPDLPDGPTARAEFYDEHDFVRETMRDPEVAEEVRSAFEGYGRDETARADESGEARGRRLRGLGRLQTLFLYAQRNAELREADGDDAVEEAEAADAERKREATAQIALWVALDRFASDPDLRNEARGEPFVDRNGDVKDDLTTSEANALRDWALNESRDGGLLDDDVGAIQAGAGGIYGSGTGAVLESRW